MEIKRKKARRIEIGGVPIGGGEPVVVQSMTNADSRDAAAVIEQIKRLEEAGCEIVRTSFPDDKCMDNLDKIRSSINIPLIADIHFKADLAVRALREGADAIRINPGNLGGLKKFEPVLKAAMEERKPMRIGVNAGSLQPKIARKYGGASAKALVESAREYINFCYERCFFDLKISLKSSDVRTTIDAYRMAAYEFDCPLHLGVTEAGTLLAGAVRSAVGMGILLAEGIGDTIRVSLSADPVEEIGVAYKILESLGIRSRGLRVIACPTCSRVEFDVSSIAERIEKRFSNEKRSLTVAVMGCAVNGPGEAREADVGVAGSASGAMIFHKGKVVEKVPPEKAEEALIKHILALLD